MWIYALIISLGFAGNTPSPKEFANHLHELHKKAEKCTASKTPTCADLDLLCRQGDDDACGEYVVVLFVSKHDYRAVTKFVKIGCDNAGIESCKLQKHLSEYFQMDCKRGHKNACKEVERSK